MGVPADAHLDAPARGRVLRPMLGHPDHRAQAFYDLLGALQRAHHARTHGLCSRAAVVDSWSAVAACLHGPASSLVCGRAASFDSSMRQARPTTSLAPRSDVRRRRARTRHTHVPAHAPRASRPPAWLLSLRIAASAVSQRRRAAYGPFAPHAPRLSPMRRLCDFALPTCRAGWPAAWHDARGRLWRRRRLRGGGGRAWPGPAVATGHAAARRAAETRLSRRCGSAVACIPCGERLMHACKKIEIAGDRMPVGEVSGGFELSKPSS